MKINLDIPWTVYLFLFVGIILLVLNTYYSIKQYKELKAYKEVIGTIYGYRKNNISGGKKSLNYNYAPKVEFEWEGERYTELTEYYMPWKRGKIGSKIDILVNPNNIKAKRYLNTFFCKWSGTVVLYFISSLFIWTCIVYMLGWKSIITP